MKSKKAKKIIIPLVCVAVIGVTVAGIIALAKAAEVTAFTGVSFVEKQESLRNYITVTGTVESQSMTKVCATFSYPIVSVNAEVGDIVRRGDVLCTLDTEALQNQILQQQAAIESSDFASQYQLTEAEKAYNDALNDYNSGKNANIITAKQALEQAEKALERAQNDYDNAVAMSKKDKNTQLQSAELNLKNAQNDLANAKKNYEQAKKDTADEDYYTIKNLKKAMDDAEKVLKEAMGTSETVREAYNEYHKAYETYVYYYTNPEQIPIGYSITDYASALRTAESKIEAVTEQYSVKNAKKAYEEAVTAYEKAKSDIDETHKRAEESAKSAVEMAEKSVEAAKIQLQAIKDNTSDGIKAYKTQLSSAQLAYENAKESLALTIKTVEANLATLKSNAERERTLSGLNSAQVISLESMKKQLEEAVVLAPCDGTVTFCGANVGNAAAGTLFALEDTENIKITAKLREYDVADVKPGMSVIITTEAAPDEEYEGVVTKIAPTAIKDLTGSDAGTSMFEIEAVITSKDTVLRIGMSAKMKIVTLEKTNVLTVPYDSISADEDGNDIIYIAEKDELGYTAKAVKVNVGMETDFLAEISGEGITEKTIVVDGNQFVTDGQSININEAELGIEAPAPETESAA